MWKDREHARQEAVSAVFGQGRVLELQWDRQRGHYPSPRAAGTGEKKGPLEMPQDSDIEPLKT